MEDVRVDFPNWTLQSAALSLDEQSLRVDVNPFSPSCEVRAPFVPLSTLGKLERADLSGKFALLYGELSSAPIFPINFEAVQFERDQAINRWLIETQSTPSHATTLVGRTPDTHTDRLVICAVPSISMGWACSRKTRR